jgi:hypothetical protein
VSSFAQKYDFKGVWHAPGKVLKQTFVRAKLKAKLVSKTDWKKLEKDNDPKLLVQKGIFVNSARTDSLVTSAT